MNDIILNAEYFIYSNDDYIVVTNENNYILNVNDNTLIEQDNINNIINISEHDKNYIINRCLDDIPF